MGLVTDVPVGTTFDLLGYAIKVLECTSKKAKFDITPPPGANFQVRRIGGKLFILPLDAPAKD